MEGEGGREGVGEREGDFPLFPTSSIRETYRRRCCTCNITTMVYLCVAGKPIGYCFISMEVYKIHTTTNTYVWMKAEIFHHCTREHVKRMHTPNPMHFTLTNKHESPPDIGIALAYCVRQEGFPTLKIENRKWTKGWGRKRKTKKKKLG